MQFEQSRKLKKEEKVQFNSEYTLLAPDQNEREEPGSTLPLKEKINQGEFICSPYFPGTRIKMGLNRVTSSQRVKHAEPVAHHAELKNKKERERERERGKEIRGCGTAVRLTLEIR